MKCSKMLILLDLDHGVHISVLGKCPWALKHALRFGLHGRLPGTISIHLYRSCYIDPLK